MNYPPLKEFLTDHFEAYLGFFVDIIKMEMYKNAQDTFAHLEWENDECFMEPLATMQLVYKPVPKFHLKQLLLGRMPEEKRLTSLKVYADKAGVVYLPAIGYLTSTYPDQELDLTISTQFDSFQLQKDGQLVESEFFPVVNYRNTPIEITRFDNEIMREMYGTKENPLSVDVDQGFAKHHDHVVKAMDLLHEVNPWYFEMVTDLIRKFVIFYNPDVRSFASKSTTGIAFFSAYDEYNEIFFLEDIIHQCAHNILYTLTVKMDEYFKVEAKYGKISEFNGNPDDYRTIYSAYHGVFSLVNIVDTFGRILNRDFDDPRKSLEVRARFVDNLRRLKKGVASLKHEEIYTERGWGLLLMIEAYCDQLTEQYASLMEGHDFTNQSYVFSFEKYLEANPVQVSH